MIVLLISNMVLIFLSMNISVAYESDAKSPKKSLNISILVLIAISVVIGVLTAFSDGFNFINGIVMGGNSVYLWITTNNILIPFTK